MSPILVVMSLKRILISLTSLVILTAASKAATFNLAGDWLADEKGTQGIPNGSLIMLIASTKDGEFSAPSNSGFVQPGSDDVVIGTFVASDASGLLNRGSYTGTIQANYGDASRGFQEFDGGDPLLIRWFPTLTRDNLEAFPTGAVPYGEFRSDSVLVGSNSAWIAPGSNGATVNLTISASSVGNRYNPQGTISLDQLLASQLLGEAIMETAQAQLEISVLSSGALSLTWPLLDSANPVGRLQQSGNLIDWTEIPVKLDFSAEGVAKASIQPETSGAVFYRIASE